MKNTKKIILGAVIALTLVIGGGTAIRLLNIDPPGGTITIQK